MLRQLNWCFLLCCGLIVFAGGALAGEPVKLRWNAESLQVNAMAEVVQASVISFVADGDAVQLRPELTPSLSGLARVSPAVIETVRAGQTYEILLVTNPNLTQVGQSVGGTLRLREGSRTLASVLPVRVAVTRLDASRPIENEYEGDASPGLIHVDGGTATGFNALGAVSFVLSGATFGSGLDDVKVYRDGYPLSGQYQWSSDRVQLDGSVLREGRNSLSLMALDSNGQTVDYNVTLWAGSRTLHGVAVDELGRPVANSEVVVMLGDDQSVVQRLTSDANGAFQILNVPARTLIIDARADGGLFGSAAANGADGVVRVPLYGFKVPSGVDNNDFRHGLDGWDVGSAPAGLVPHIESSVSIENAAYPQLGRVGEAERAALHQRYSSGDEPPSRAIASTSSFDLALRTSGDGIQHASRTFQARSGARSIKVRYRFITTEVPGGFFGTQFNDYFNVTITSKAAGGVVSESRSMNGLGLAAFDPSGATDWRETSLAIAEEGDVVQVDLTVANIADGLLDSTLVVDFIEEPLIAISELTLHDIDGSALGLLSADEHNYFAGSTRVHGTITVEGPENDDLNDLVLEVVQGGGVVATASLSSAARGGLLKSFSSAGDVSQKNSALLFELSSGQAKNVFSGVDGTALLRVRASSLSGDDVVREAGSVVVLAKYDGTLRYGGRDEIVGGGWLGEAKRHGISGVLSWIDVGRLQ